MITVYLTKGLPGSGKSTWAKETVNKNPNSYKRVNKDELREMLDCGHWSRDAEKFILNVRDQIILQAIEEGKHVIIDDTNLASKHIDRISLLVKKKARIEIVDFTDVPIETCIKRDLKRLNSVGEKVIRDMYKQFLEVREEYIEDCALPEAIIVDMDGCLAHMQGRSPFDWSKVGEDFCDEVVKGIVNNYKGTVIIMSGRDEVCRLETLEWLVANEINFDYLYMREKDNLEKDTIVKRKLFEQNIRGKYYVKYSLDDRNCIVDLWRSMGIKCLQVQEGNF